MSDGGKSVESYRIEQLEKELGKLRSETKTLNFQQIKQMFKWLGVPVGVVTGVFGIALWKMIETSAGERAQQEVQEISQDISRLETRTAELARGAEAMFGDLREISGRADEAARAVRTRADEARTQANEAERLLVQLRRELASASEVQTLLKDTGDIASGLATNKEFQEIVAGAALENFSGAVVAFDLPGDCPEGWTAFDAAAGRMIIGVGLGSRETQDGVRVPLTERRQNDEGGEETHTLTYDETPSFKRPSEWGTTRESNAEKVMTPILAYQDQDLKISDRDGLKIVTTGEENSGAIQYLPVKYITNIKQDNPHNNMPPYIALHFCKKINKKAK